jgi:hypothetical protein
MLLAAAAAIPIAANNWLMTVLRLSGRLRAIVASSGVYAVAICALAWFLASHGLAVLTAAWPIGGLVGAGVAAASIPRREPPPHRLTVRQHEPGAPISAPESSLNSTPELG